MSLDDIVLKRYNGPDWVFKWDPIVNQYRYKARRYLYQLFFPDGDYNMIWVGTMVNGGWVNDTRIVRPRALVLFNAVVFFSERERQRALEGKG